MRETIALDPVTTADDTSAVYSASVRAPFGASRVAAIAQVPNTVTVDITVEGSMDNAVWTDTALSATTLTDGVGQCAPGDGDGTIFAVWNYYRFRVENAAAIDDVLLYFVGMGD